MKQFRLLLAASFLAVLVACGGPAGPVVPNATSVTPTTAERGATIVIAGSGFGTTPGTVTVGGVTANVSDWTASSITATVPAGAPNAWQDVSVTTTGGSDTLSGLFVGVAFTGTGPQLQGFLDGLDIGTAVLLQEGTYDLSAQTVPFFIDNKDLYGRGPTQTTIVQPTAQEAYVLAKFGEAVTIADLELQGKSFAFLHGTVTDTYIPTSVARRGSLPSGGDELRTYVTQLLDEAALAPASASNSRVILDDVTYSGVGAGMWGLPFAALPKVDLTIRDSTISMPDGSMGLVVGGDLLIVDSQLNFSVLQAMALGGQLDVVGSSLNAAADMMLGADSGLNVDGSTVRNANGDIGLFGALSSLMGGLTIPTGGAIEVRGSTVEALDANLLDAADIGGLMVMTQFAPIALIDNVLVRAHGPVSLVVADAQIGDGDIDVRGNGDIRVGVFASESATGARESNFTAVPVSSSIRNRVTLADNTFAVTGILRSETSATPGNVFVTNNTITAGDSASVGNVGFGATGEGVLELVGNRITANGQVVLQGSDLHDETMLVTGNTFTSQVATAHSLVMQGNGGSCAFNDNDVVMDDPSDTLTSSVTATCIGADPSHTFTFTGNDMRATGNPGSTIIILATGVASATVDDNRLNSGAAVAFQVLGAALDFTDNVIQQESGTLYLAGTTGSAFSVTGNTVVQQDPVGPGLSLFGASAATVTGNTFTGQGTPGAGATALSIGASSNAITVTATGNTFTNYTNALSLNDQAIAANGITASINDNVFDFPINAAPKVATLTNVKDAINATDNQWGSNTVLATVQGYVTLAGDTVGQGGSILLDPITVP